MNFERKIFSWFYGLILVVGVIVAVVASYAARERLTFEYVKRYQTLGAALAESFTQMEALGEQVSLNALHVLREVEAKHGLPSDEELDELAHGLGVTSFYITDAAGRFIRSSDTPLDKQTPSIFGFCDDYRLLLTGRSAVEITPIAPGNPTPRPTKFTSIANSASDRILESSYNLEFVGKILAEVVQGDDDIASAALFSPNGVRLGEMDSGGDLHWTNRGQPFTPWFGERVSSHLAEFSIRVPASVRNCCECRIDGLSREQIDYHYILRLRTSSAKLMKDIGHVYAAIAMVTVAAAFVAAILAHMLSRHLVSGLKRIEQTATAIIAAGSLTERVPAPSGQDEVFRLAQTFNLMMESLEVAVGKSVEAERLGAIARVASQVAHDIRSPLSALQATLGDLARPREETRVLMRNAIFRIQDIANHLLSHHNKSETTGSTPAKQVSLVSSLCEVVTSEIRMRQRHRLGVSIEMLQDATTYGAFISVETSLFQRMLSNLITNAAEACPETHGTVIIKILHSETHAVVEVADNGVGIPPEILAKLGNESISFGKADGHGLGVRAAFDLIHDGSAHGRGV